jgi:hydrogenase/urease accessory protein HupE
LAQTGFLTGFMHPLTGLALGWALRGANVWLARAAGGAVAVFGTALLVPMT